MMMRIGNLLTVVLSCGLMLAVTGCATLEVTERKSLTAAVERQNVNLGLLALGDRLQDTLNGSDSQVIGAASSQLFAKVVMLPKESRLMQPQEMKKAYGVDYVLTVGISDISVSGDLNPIWFPSLLILMFKVYAPIVTFQPGVALDVNLRDAASGNLLLQKQVMESSSDHYAPANPSDKVRKLISLTINNAMVTVMRDTQQSIAAARKAGK
jgi:hypothetical protein